MSRLSIHALLWVAFSTSSITKAQLFPMQMERVPYNASDPATQQPGGPGYSYSMGRYEVTVTQFVSFLNDAEANQANERGANLAFRSWGDVGLLVDNVDNDYIFDLSYNSAVYGLTYNVGSPVGTRYNFDSAFGQHPILGVSWYGALKFSNWLTIDHGLPLNERVYHEGPSAGDWYVSAAGATGPLTDFERQQVVGEYLGYRLPMDMNGESAGLFNEWYKAAAWDGSTMTNHAYGFGRDVLTGADANYSGSGDPWESGTTPIGYYDGINPGTNANGNSYGIYDLAGNVMEWTQDWDDTGRRILRGGAWVDSDPARLRNDFPRDNWPRSTTESAGFRLVQVPEPTTLLLLSTASIVALRRRRRGTETWRNLGLVAMAVRQSRMLFYPGEGSG